MSKLAKKLLQKLENREENNALRVLSSSNNLIDFSSNNYLGFANNETLYANTFQYLLNKEITQNGAAGSRLLTGNHEVYIELEKQLVTIHQSESALVFNSGYDANIGFFSAVPQRNDIIFYDEFIHASIRDGISMSKAKNFKFKHNDLDDLELGIERSRNAIHRDKNSEIYIVTESVFSMDGDSPDLKSLTDFCSKNNIYLIVDEAHAVGIFEKNGLGLVQELGLEKQIFARIVTFGKALGAHGAAVLGSQDLKDYLINFARSFIYTTGLAPHAVATALNAYLLLNSEEGKKQQNLLKENIAFFRSKIEALQLNAYFIKSNSAIQSCLIKENNKVKSISKKLSDKGFDVKAILAPTVPEGQERLRFCLHSFNSKEEIGLVLQLIKKHLK